MSLRFALELSYYSLPNRVDPIASEIYEEFRDVGLKVDWIPLVMATRDVMDQQRVDDRRHTSWEAERKNRRTFH